MKTVEIYTVNYCQYCFWAKELLNNKGIKYKELDITEDEDELRKKLGEYYSIEGEITVPQIIIGGKRIGGYNELKALDESEELDRLINEE